MQRIDAMNYNQMNVCMYVRTVGYGFGGAYDND